MADDPPVSNVVPLFRKAEYTPRFKRGHADGKLCQHKQMVIDGLARRLFCIQCNAELDPYAEIEKIATEERSYQWLWQETGRLRRECETLEDEVKKLKAARRRLRKPRGL